MFFINYFAITCDIINSRKLLSAESKKLLEKKLNSAQFENILTKIVLLKGDEFQFLAGINADIPMIIRNLRIISKPFSIRIGVGFGSIFGDISENPWEMNGKAFYNSRDALEYAKNNKLKTFFKSENKIADEVINQFYILTDRISENWTEKQTDAIIHIAGGKTLKETADALKIKNWQTVQKRLKSADWDIVKSTENVIHNLIHYYWGE